MGSQYLSLKHYKMEEVKQFPPLSAVSRRGPRNTRLERARKGGREGVDNTLGHSVAVMIILDQTSSNCIGSDVDNEDIGQRAIHQAAAAASAIQMARV